MTIRPAGREDADFLAEMLAVAADWRPGVPTRSVEMVLSEPTLAHYIEGWPRTDDFGVVAEASGPVGAAWWRFLGREDPGFGFVDETIPEVTIGVVRDRRGRGIGRSLLEALAGEAAGRGLPGLCLSVEPDNYALRLYEQVGFRFVEDTGGAVTMLLGLGGLDGSARPGGGI